MKPSIEYQLMQLRSDADLARIQARGRLAERVYGVAWLTVTLVLGWLVVNSL